MTQTSETRLKDAMHAAHPTADPSPSLVEQVAVLAHAADARSAHTAPSRPVFRLTAAAAAALLAVLAGTTFFSPRRVLARTLRQVSANLTRATSVHYRLVIYDARGREAIRQEVWQQGGRWRLDGGVDERRFTQILANGRFWHYDPDRRTAWYQADDSTEPLPVTVRELPARARQALSGPKGTVLGTETREGRRLLKVAIPGAVQATPWMPTTPGRTLFEIDEATLLPASMEQQAPRGDAWVPVLRTEYEFDETFPPDRFTIPQVGVRTYDINAYGAEVGRRFARPLAVRKFATRTIALRGLEVNAEGDVFVLYTDGSTRDAPGEETFAEVTDSLGTRYFGTAGGIDPFMYHQDRQSSRGITVGDEVMRGTCVVPVVPPTRPWQPRRITVDIRFNEYRGKRYFTRSARFTVPVRRSSSTLLPTYGPDLLMLSLSGGDPEQFRRDRAHARQVHCYNREDWPGLLRAADNAMQEGITDFYTFLHRAMALTELRRPVEARQALARATEEDRFGGHQHELSKAEERLRPVEGSAHKR